MCTLYRSSMSTYYINVNQNGVILYTLYIITIQDIIMIFKFKISFSFYDDASTWVKIVPTEKKQL